MSPSAEWVLLAYRLPREPSTPRIAVWRKLRQLGAAQLLDGLVALPLDARNRERFDWLAAEIVEAGGEAAVWHGTLASRRQQRELVAAMKASVAAEYGRVIDEAEAVCGGAPGSGRRALGRLRRELRRIQARDYFPSAAREHAERAVDRLGQVVEEALR